MDILEFMKRRADIQSLMLSVGTVCAGTAAAALRGNAEVIPASLCLLFAVIAQIGCNLYHYYRFINFKVTHAGGLRIPSAKLEATATEQRVLNEGSKAALLLSLTVGITIMTMAKDFWWTLIVGVVLYVLMYLMARYPAIYRNPLSLIITYIIFGPIGVIGTALLQFQHEAVRTLWNFFDGAPALYMAQAMGFLACSHHIVMSYFNRRIDPNPNRPSVAKSFGRIGSAVVVALNGLLTFAIITFMAFKLEVAAPLLVIIPGFLAFCMNSYIAIRMPYAAVVELSHLNRLTRVNFMMTGLVSLVIWIWVGAPDDSVRVLFALV